MNDVHGQPHESDTEGEHALQLRLLHAIEEALGDSKREKALELLTQLEHLSEAHFAAEQILMRRLSYPEYWTHEREHGELMSKLGELQAHVTGAASSSLPAEAVAIREWLVGHMTSSDHAFARFMEKA